MCICVLFSCFILLFYFLPRSEWSVHSKALCVWSTMFLPTGLLNTREISGLGWHATLCSIIHRVTELFSIRNLLLSKVSSSDENGILNPPRMIYPFFFLIFLHIEKIQHFMYMYLLWSHFLWGLQTLLIFSDCLHPLRINPTQNLFGV